MLKYIHTRQALNTAGKLLEGKLKRQLKIDGTVATKKLLNSISYSLSFGEDTNKLLIWANKSIAYVDRGRKEGKAPAISTILKWAEAKGLRPRGSNGSFIENNKRNRYWMARNIAKSIGEHGTIKRFGYAGSNILDFVMKQNKPTVQKSVMDAFQRDLHDFVQYELANKQ